MEKIETEVVEETTEETTEETSTEEVESEGWFKRTVNAIKAFFKKVFSFAKEKTTWCKDKIAGTKIGTFLDKVKAFFCGTEGSTTIIKDTGLLGKAADKSGKLAGRFYKKLSEFLGNHKVLAVITKILAIAGAGAFGILTICLVIKMLPAIICGVAEIVGAAFVIYGIFFIIDFALGRNKVAEND